MGLTVFAVPGPELEEIPLLPVLVQVVADGVELVLVQRLGTTHSDAPSCGRSRASTAAGSRRDDQDRLVRARVEQGDCGGRAGISQVAEVIGQLDVPAALGTGQPSGGGGHGGAPHWGCA